MRKCELIGLLASRCKLPTTDVTNVLDTLADITYEHAANGFTIPGICRLRVREKPASRCRNPQSGQMMLLKARPALKIVALKKAIDMIAPRPDDYMEILPPEAIQDKPTDTPQAHTHSSPDRAAGFNPDTMLTQFQMETPDNAAIQGDILFSCPQCGATLSSQAGTEGMDCDCPTCGQQLIVPLSDKPAPLETSGSHAQSALVGDFITFVCHTCQQEIEAPSSMAGSSSYCPACGAGLAVPHSSMLPEELANDPDIFSRTIRIDLSDLGV